MAVCAWSTNPCVCRVAEVLRHTFGRVAGILRLFVKLPGAVTRPILEAPCLTPIDRSICHSQRWSRRRWCRRDHGRWRGLGLFVTSSPASSPPRQSPRRATRRPVLAQRRAPSPTVKPRPTFPSAAARSSRQGRRDAALAGTFKAFSSTCTHEGCAVSVGQADNKIRCACHNSYFDAATGRRSSGQDGPSRQDRDRLWGDLGA
jgi:hypothetical protein